MWLDKAELRIYRIDFFDRRMKLSKRFTAKGYKQYKTRYWRPDNVVMKNTKNGRYTEITYSDYNFGVKLTDADFHKSVLKRP